MLRKYAMQTCFLVGAASNAVRIAPQAGDFVIAADGGYDHLVRWGIVPDMIVGDIDSLQSALPENISHTISPAEKDDTDMALAFWEGHRRGFRHFVLVGANSNERPDHTMANLQLLVKAAALGATAIMQDETWQATAIHGPGELHLSGTGTVSVFAYGEQATGVTIAGMKYDISNATLFGNRPLGVSNELADRGTVSVAQGTLLVYALAGVQFYK